MGWIGKLCLATCHQRSWLDFCSAILLKQSAARHVAPLGHIIRIPNQPVFVFTP